MPDTLTQAGLGTLAAAVRRRLKHVVAQRIEPYGLTIQQLWVMLVLLEQGPSSLHPLAQQVWMDDPTASRVVKVLVERGLLRTQPDPHHGRRILITLAPQGQALAGELQALASEIKRGIVAGLSSEQQAQLRMGLMVMIHNLDGMQGELDARSAGRGAAAS